MGIDKFPQELYKSYRNYLMKRYYAFFHVFFLMEITKTEKKSHVFAVAPHAGAWIEICHLRLGTPHSTILSKQADLSLSIIGVINNEIVHMIFSSKKAFPHGEGAALVPVEIPALLPLHYTILPTSAKWREPLQNLQQLPADV